MALQGDLRSFSLPDVLRLLAGTAKTGSLEVTCAPAHGEVWMLEGGVVGGVVSTAAYAVRPADVVLELLRLDGGSFAFDDTDEIEPAPATNVNDVLVEAEALLAEWREVERVIPSMAAWMSLSPALDADEITVKADDWRMLAAVGGGGTVRDLATVLELTDLDASRRAKALVEAGLLAVRVDLAVDEAPAPVDEAPEPEALVDEVHEVDEADDVEDLVDPVAEAQEADLAVLRSDDRTVVMVTAEDALLPEPLPGEGVSFEGIDLPLGTVDGRTFEAIEQEALAERGAFDDDDDDDDDDDLDGDAGETVDEETGPEAATDLDDAAVDAAFDAVAARAEEAGEHVPDLLAVHDAPLAEVPEPVRPDQVVAAEPPAPADDDRDSLLKFLSTVKP